MAKHRLTLRPSPLLLLLLPLLLQLPAGSSSAGNCLDVRWCHCDAQNTLRCLMSEEAELRAVTAQLSAGSGRQLRLADLVVRGLPTLPGGLFRGTQLHGLLLSGSQAQQLPDDLLAGLEHFLLALGLGENRLLQVPTAALRSLERLERLDLSGNQLRRVEKDALGSQPQLQELNLADNEISELEGGAFALLPRLATLSLEGNLLTEKQLGGGALSQVVSLRQLALDNNHLTGALTQQMIGSLPSQLTKLTLSQNNLTSVDAGALARLGNLTELDLSRNKIDVISDRSFVSLGLLQTLRLNTNHIVTLPSAGFSGLKTLTSLDLSHNFLQSVTSDTLLSLTALRQLYLRDNELIYLDGTLFDRFPALKRLDISENPLHCDCRLRELAAYLSASRHQLTSDDLDQVTCMTPSHLENAPLAILTSKQLVCEESIQYDDMEPRPGDASHQIQLESAQLAADGGGAQLRWHVDAALSPFRCDHVFVFEPHAGHEQMVAGVPAVCGERQPSGDDTRLLTDVRWPELRAGRQYRFCLLLVELTPASPALRPSCSEPVGLAAPAVPPPPPELAAFGANMTSGGRVTVFLRVLHTRPARPCVVTVLLQHDGQLLATEQMACSLPLLALQAPGRAGARACVTQPHNGTDGGPPQPPAQCVWLRQPAAARRWWHTPAAAALLGCVLAALLVAAAGAVWCLHQGGRCRLAAGNRYKWAGRPGVGFVRTAVHPPSASEENINRETEETDSQV